MAKVTRGANKGKEDEITAWGLNWVELKELGPYGPMSLQYSHLEMEAMKNSKRSPFNNKKFVTNSTYTGFWAANNLF